jgi:PP-loop superfamily ATP-utilizing enzyme
LPRKELELARETARAIGARLEVIATDEMEDESLPRERRRPLLLLQVGALPRDGALGARAGLPRARLRRDRRRPARRAARRARRARVRVVVAPLSEAGFTKEDVRRYAR